MDGAGIAGLQHCTATAPLSQPCPAVPLQNTAAQPSMFPYQAWIRAMIHCQYTYATVAGFEGRGIQGENCNSVPGPGPMLSPPCDAGVSMETGQDHVGRVYRQVDGIGLCLGRGLGS